MDNQQDIEWIKLLKKDNIQAFNQIYAKYHQALYRNILKIIKDTQVAEDLLQDVYIALWEHRSEIDTGKSLGGWLFVVSYNKAVNYMKKELRKAKIKNSISLYYSEESESDYNSQYEQQFGLLQNAISKLSPQKQKTFVLCKIEGKSYKEAAEILNISKYTVKEYLSSAMCLVKDYIKD